MSGQCLCGRPLVEGACDGCQVSPARCRCEAHADPLAKLRATEALDPDKRGDAAADALREVCEQGLDATTAAKARDFLKRTKVLPVASFEEIRKDARRGRGRAATPTVRATPPRASAQERQEVVLEGVVVAGFVPAPSDPMAVARHLLTRRTKSDCLRFWRGGWMEWRGPHWEEGEDKAIRAWAYCELEGTQYVDDNDQEQPWKPNRHKIADALDALAAISHLPGEVTPPAWLVGDQPAPAGEIVACGNGLLHVGTRERYEHTPDYFGLVSVPFDWDPDAPEPARWLKFLAELWPDDPDAIAALQEFFGYVLSGRTDLHKIMLLIGPTRSGKGTIARVLAALIGKGHVAGPTLASLGTNFGLMPLLGKPLAVVSDARLGGPDTRVVVERLLSVSGEDTLTVDRKYRDQWTGQLPTRFLILSNELPRFGDASGAIAHRFVVLTLQHSWLGHEDSRLTAELLKELPGILAWSLDGLDRLARQGCLSEPKSSAEAVTALQDLVSPVAAFVRDACERGAYEIEVKRLFAAWREWCEGNGHKPGSQQVFGRDLRAVIPSLRVRQPRDEVTSQPVRHYVGLKLRASAAHSGEPCVSSRFSDQGADPAEPVKRGETRANSLWTPVEQEPTDGAAPEPPCETCGARHHRYGDGGTPCRTTELVTSSAVAHAATEGGPAPSGCIGPGCPKRARNACSTCWEHAYLEARGGS